MREELHISDVFMLFDKIPAALPLYEAAKAKIVEAFPEAKIKVSKTQVGFFNRHGFAWLWPPIRRVKGWPKVCLVLTFGLPCRLQHPRIAAAVEPYPNRWTHHVIFASPEDLDEQLMGWLRESYEFSMLKGRKRI